MTTVRQAQKLLSKQQAAKARSRQADDDFARAVAELVAEPDMSVRKLARALGLPSATMEDWIKRGRMLRGQPPQR